MTTPLDRRTFLCGSAVAAGSALTCTAMVRTAAGEVVPRIEAPLVDKLVIQVVVDGAHDIFIPEQKVPDIGVAHAGFYVAARNRRRAARIEQRSERCVNRHGAKASVVHRDRWIGDRSQCVVHAR